MAGYADALGAKARNGYSAFVRQDLIGADYGLLDCATALPLPDYFTALLFARLMGPRALDVRATRTSGIGARRSSETANAPFSVAAGVSVGGNTADGGMVRLYAHCARAPAANGAVALLAVNLASQPANVTLLGNGGWALRTEYELSPSKKSGPLGLETGILGSGVMFNGAGPLALTAAGKLPDLSGRKAARSGPVVVGPESIMFVVFTEAFAPACQ